MEALAEEVEDKTLPGERLLWRMRQCIYGPRELKTTTSASAEEDGPEHSETTTDELAEDEE